MLQKLLKDHQLYHSEFQQDYLITSKAGGTQYGQYKQALRELHKRYRGLKQLKTERALLQVDIDELETMTTDNEYETRRNKIKLAQKIMSMEEMDLNIKETEREFKRFYQQAVALSEQIGELTEDKRNKLDVEMWEYKLKEAAAIDFISNGRLKNTTVEMLMAFPVFKRKQLLAEIKDQGRLIDWYENRTHTQLQLPETDINVKLLLEGDEQ